MGLFEIIIEQGTKLRVTTGDILTPGTPPKLSRAICLPKMNPAVTTELYAVPGDSRLTPPSYMLTLGTPTTLHTATC